MKIRVVVQCVRLLMISSQCRITKYELRRVGARKPVSVSDPAPERRHVPKARLRSSRSGTSQLSAAPTRASPAATLYALNLGPVHRPVLT